MILRRWEIWLGLKAHLYSLASEYSQNNTSTPIKFGKDKEYEFGTASTTAGSSAIQWSEPRTAPVKSMFLFSSEIILLGSRRRVVKVCSLTGESSLKVRRIQFSDPSETKISLNSAEKSHTSVNEEKEELRRVEDPWESSKSIPDPLPTKDVNPCVDFQKPEKFGGLDQKQSKSSLNLQSTRKFVPKTKPSSAISEFKLEFVLNSEFTLSLKVTKDSNPFKLAEYILSQMEFANQDYFTESSLHQMGLQSKFHTK